MYSKRKWFIAETPSGKGFPPFISVKKDQ